MAENDASLIRTANGYVPEARQTLTEGYQPTGSDEIPVVIPALVSGVCPPPQTAPTPNAAPTSAE